MLKHAAILAVAVLSAIAAVQGLDALASPRTVAQTALLAVAKSADGHYWADADVNGRPVRLLVDTGASAVALTGADAQRLGLDLTRLNYAHPVTTANGETKAAMVKLDHITVAGARIDGVSALVVRDGLSTSLLGMSYLGRLSRFEATPTSLTLQR